MSDGNQFAYNSGSLFSWLWDKKKDKKQEPAKKTAPKEADVVRKKVATDGSVKSSEQANPKLTITLRTIYE